jgi:ribosomal protein S18 acetylase RimI-like enzyme
MLAASLIRNPWLTERMGRPVYDFKPTSDTVRTWEGGNLPPAALIEHFAGQAAFVSAKVPAAELGRVRMLEHLGFGLVETAQTLSRPAAGPPSPKGGCEIGPAQAGEAGEVAAVAKASFVWDRFHLDPLIPEAVAAGIKEQWAANFFRGARGDAMLVARRRGAVAGFLQLIFDSPVLVIDLVAVDPLQRGAGVAHDLIARAMSSLGGFQTVRVGTQALNLPSLRLYAGLGFRVESCAYTYHLHLQAE